MFDIGFSELLVIAIVALIVIGPEKLPKVARTVGHLLGKAQRYVTDLKTEINREMEIDELRKLQAEMQDAARKIGTDVQTTLRDVQTGLNETAQPMGIPEQTTTPIQPDQPDQPLGPHPVKTESK